jgi:hypothetical protein
MEVDEPHVLGVLVDAVGGWDGVPHRWAVDDDVQVGELDLPLGGGADYDWHLEEALIIGLVLVVLDVGREVVGEVDGLGVINELDPQLVDGELARGLRGHADLHVVELVPPDVGLAVRARQV